MKKPGNFGYHLLALGVVLVWGTTFVSSKVLLLEGLTPQEIFFYRFLLAYVLMLGYSLCAGGKHTRQALRKKFCTASLRDEGMMVALGITGGSLYFYTENTALQYTATTNISLILCVTPLLTAVLLRGVYRDLKTSFTRRFVIGSAAALMGISVVILNGHFVLHLSIAGDALCFAAAFCWAFYTLLMKAAEKKYSILLITRRVFFYGLLTILPLYLPLCGQRTVQFFLQPTVWGNLLYLGVVASLLCYFFWNVVLQKINPMHATNYIYFSPVITAVTASLILHETITWMTVCGTVLIIGGVYFAQASAKK